MKKIIPIILSFMLVLGLSACSNGNSEIINDESALSGTWQIKASVAEDGTVITIEEQKKQGGLEESYDFILEISETLNCGVGDGTSIAFQEELIVNKDKTYTCSIEDAGFTFDIWLEKNSYDCIKGEYVLKFKQGDSINIFEKKSEVNTSDIDFEPVPVDKVKEPDEPYEPEIGMTTYEVESSTFGIPDDINTTTTSSGTEEQWVYEIGVHTYYLYFENGILTTIQER